MSNHTLLIYLLLWATLNAGDFGKKNNVYYAKINPEKSFKATIVDLNGNESVVTDLCFGSDRESSIYFLGNGIAVSLEDAHKIVVGEIDINDSRLVSITVYLNYDHSDTLSLKVDRDTKINSHPIGTTKTTLYRTFAGIKEIKDIELLKTDKLPEKSSKKISKDLEVNKQEDSDLDKEDKGLFYDLRRSFNRWWKSMKKKMSLTK